GLKQASARWPAATVEQQQPVPAKPEEEFKNLVKLENAARAFHKDRLEELLETAAERRDPDKVRQALAELPQHIRRFREAAARLDALGPVAPGRREQERLA